ncbi:unnamed protein product [Amaranthus hypochondriacus]
MAAALASPPSSQTMVSSSPSPPQQSSEFSSSTSSDQADRIGRAFSYSKNVDSSSADFLKSEEYRQLFRLPSEEVLLQDFNCALQENILLQGHMYLFEHYICFYSNIFGFETKKIIPFQEVTSVRRAKTAGIFPNAIEIVAAGKKHFFASFLSRDEAFKLIADGWSQQGNGSEEMLDRQDSKSESSSQINGVVPTETCNSESQVNDLCSHVSLRNLELSTSEESKPPSGDGHDNARSAAPEVPHVLEEKLNVTEPSTSPPLNWNVETQDAPEIHNSYTKVAKSKFPISVEQFFNLYISDEAASFVESYHNKCGDKEFRCTSWSPHKEFGYTRVKSFQHPIKVYFGAKCGGCKETQKFQIYKSSHLVIKTSQEVSDVPYADYFTVEGLWDVQKDGSQSDGCFLQVFVNVAFSKKTMFKGKIEQSTMEECREVYATWIQLAHELLKQKNIEKGESSIPNMLQDGLIDSQVTGQSVEHSDTNVQRQRINVVANKSRGTHEQTGNSLLENLLHVMTTMMSTLRAFSGKFYNPLKNHPQLFLVIAFSAILLLMQLSIVVLLSRPQPVYVIPQVDQMSSAGHGAGHRAAETVAWMEKRVHLLKDEMLLVESQLERMRHEHILLKSQLKDLERLYK